VKVVSIRLEGDHAAVKAARERIAEVLDIEVRSTRERHGRGGDVFVHEYLQTAVEVEDER
jgi:hypothetical protein